MTEREYTQKEQVKAHLLEHGQITPLTALDQFGCLRLASVIYRLRKDGFVIQTDEVERTDKNGKRYRYANYRLQGRTRVS